MDSAMLPGGGVEEGETMRSAAIREALEETGLVVELTGYLGDFDDVHSRRRYYVAKRIGGKPAVIDKDGDRPVHVQVVSIERARELVSSEYDRAALEKLGREVVIAR